jgi:hypothetical protein
LHFFSTFKNVKMILSSQAVCTKPGFALYTGQFANLCLPITSFHHILDKLLCAWCGWFTHRFSLMKCLALHSFLSQTLIADLLCAWAAPGTVDSKVPVPRVTYISLALAGGFIDLVSVLASLNLGLF